MRECLEGKKDPQCEEARTQSNSTEKQITQNHRDHPAAACTAGRPHTQAQSCVGKVSLFKRGGKMGN